MQDITQGSEFIAHLPVIISGFFSFLGAIFVYLLRREVGREKNTQEVTNKAEIEYKKTIDERIKVQWEKHDVLSASFHDLELKCMKVETQCEIMLKEIEEIRKKNEFKKIE